MPRKKKSEETVVDMQENNVSDSVVQAPKKPRRTSKKVVELSETTTATTTVAVEISKPSRPKRQPPKKSAEKPVESVPEPVTPIETRAPEPKKGVSGAPKADVSADAEIRVRAEVESRPRSQKTRASTPTKPRPRSNAAAQTTPVSEPDVPTKVQSSHPRRWVKRGSPGQSRPSEKPAKEPISVVQEAVHADSTKTIPLKDAVLEFFRKYPRPWHVKDVERQLVKMNRKGLPSSQDLEALLEDLTEQGILIQTRKRTYGLVESMNLIKGRFQASTQGFGFVIPEPGTPDLYIPHNATLEAWNGDIVLARFEGQRRGEDSPRGSVARIISRSCQRLVGTLEFSKGYAMLRPDDPKVPQRILLLPEGAQALQSGSRVVVDLYYPETTGEDEVYGEVRQLLGLGDQPEVETAAVILKYGLYPEFSQEALLEAERVALESSSNALSGRLDLRSRAIFTIDGRDAKDFDDAIHIENLDGGGFLVGIHIADVSHYVREGSALDKDAVDRATSVYLPGHVLPMLPERLSNGVCSLVPGEDRLTLSVLAHLNADAELIDYTLTPSIIHSKARLTYDEVQAYSEGVASMPEQARSLEGDLHLLLKLTNKMRNKRLKGGSLDFKLREVKVEVESDGGLTLVPIREETARGLIEDLMLLANKIVAQYMLKHHVPTLFRVHEDPSPTGFQEASQKIARFGFVFQGIDPTPQAYQAILKQARGSVHESLVNQVLLRSLQQARYSEENLGHFGLAFEEYLHFTSPIRRYPDLLVHRALRQSLEGRLSSDERVRWQSELPTMAKHTSDRERLATDAERDLTKYYYAKWAQGRLGEVFWGRISGLLPRGMFVELENGIEGFVHVSEFGDEYFVYLEEAQMFKGRSSGQTFRFGDRVMVKVIQVNPLARQIDFAWVDSKGETKATAQARKEESHPKKVAAPPAEPKGSVKGKSQHSQSRSGSSASEPQERAPRSSAPPKVARRIVTLERSRAGYSRPVNASVHKIYFGDWALDSAHLGEEDVSGLIERVKISRDQRSQNAVSETTQRRKKRRKRRSSAKE